MTIDLMERDQQALRAEAGEDPGPGPAPEESLPGGDDGGSGGTGEPEVRGPAGDLGNDDD